MLKKLAESYIKYWLKKNDYKNLETIISIDGCGYYLRHEEIENQRRKTRGI